jgi:transcriptional regulator NrdR family protein
MGQNESYLCSGCGGHNVGVIDSRTKNEQRIRRRKCRSCGHRWTTIEVDFAVGRTIAKATAQLLIAEKALLEVSKLLKTIRESALVTDAENYDE